MFDGYLSLGTTEIINAARTAAYVQNNLPSFPLRARPDLGDMHLALDDNEYESPLVDDAPWLDESNPATRGFFGLYPLSIEGVDGSTRTAAVVEGIVDGGTVTSFRHSSRQIRVRGLLLAADELALDAGMTWLRAALNGLPCVGGGCDDKQLHYFAARPQLSQQFRDYTQSTRLELGSVAPLTSPLIVRPEAGYGKLRAEWMDVAIDGAIIRWGAMAPETSKVLESHGPVVPLRTNFMLNPSFTVGLSKWTLAGPASMDQQTSGGVDDGPYARVTPTTSTEPGAPSSVRENWIANSSVEYGTPVQSGWTTNGDLTFEMTLGAPHGDNTAAALQIGTEADLWVSIPIQGPVAPISGTLSFSLGQMDQAVRASVLDGTGAVAASVTFTPSQLTAAWQRLSLPSTFGQGYRLRIATLVPATRTLRLDALMAGDAGAYFDGDSPDGGGVNAWTGVTDNSTSTQTSNLDSSVVTNLVPNPRAATSTGATLPTSYGDRPEALGFSREDNSLGWQSTLRVYQGSTALAIEWTDGPYPNTFYPDTMYPA